MIHRPFVIFLGVYTVCEDKVDQCSSYGPDICFKYTTWAAVQCPKFCVFCERRFNVIILNAVLLLVLYCLAFSLKTPSSPQKKPSPFPVEKKLLLNPHVFIVLEA